VVVQVDVNGTVDGQNWENVALLQGYSGGVNILFENATHEYTPAAV
jgi:hypothetical protein